MFYFVITVFVVIVLLALILFVNAPKNLFFSNGCLRVLLIPHIRLRGLYDYVIYRACCEFHVSPVKFIYRIFKIIYRKLIQLVSLYNLFSLFLFSVGLFVQGRLSEIWLLFFKGAESYSALFLTCVRVVFTILGSWFLFEDYCNAMLDRNQRIQVRQSAYKNIDVPDKGWEKVTFVPDQRLATWDMEDVFINESINQWLRSSQQISLKRVDDYEKGLMRQITDRRDWEKMYSLFLRQKYLDTRNSGSQFINEIKFGISSELNPSDGYVKIHRTCYYDSFLTNIISGRELINSAKMETIASTETIMPYDVNRKLRTLDNDIYRAGEPGISTLMLLPDGRILLWRQNFLVDSNAGRIAPSGSGSVDWDDCKKFLNDSNGFRQAIIRAMQRELWEESYSARGKISMDDFFKIVETRITGCFRWLQKAGKYEFTGVTRVATSDRAYILELNHPEASNIEVTDITEGIQASDMKAIITVSDLRRNFQKLTGCNIGGYSVPCVMAILALLDICKNCSDEEILQEVLFR